MEWGERTLHHCPLRRGFGFCNRTLDAAVLGIIVEVWGTFWVLRLFDCQ